MKMRPKILWLGNLGSDRSALDDLLAPCERRAQLSKQGKPVAPRLPSRRLNEILGGGLPVGLTVLHGAPGAGKSAFALQCACECGCPALIISAELPVTELLLRITARVNEKPRRELQYMPRDQLEPLLMRAVQASPHLGVVDLTRYAPPTNAEQGNGLQELLAQFTEALREYNARDVQAPYPLLVVDSVHTVARLAGDAYTREYDLLTGALTYLDMLARYHGVAVLGIAERNREAMQGGGLTAAAGHRLFEYIAEAMLSLDVERDQNGEMKRINDDMVLMKVRVLKNRNGEIGEVPVTFDGRRMRFTEG
jgi:predicted ATP-dependent serine protease